MQSVSLFPNTEAGYSLRCYLALIGLARTHSITASNQDDLALPDQDCHASWVPCQGQRRAARQ
jgi:hypothetical protein